MAWGEVLKARARQVTGDERKALLEEALKFVRRPRSAYALTHEAETLTLLERPDEALNVLREGRERDARMEGNLWFWQRSSEAYAAMDQAGPALECAERPCSLMTEGDPWSEYLVSWHADRLVAVGRHEEADALRVTVRRND